MTANLVRKITSKLSPKMLARIFNLWRPFRAAGIKITHISADFTEVNVEMTLRWYNQNYVGTHFGGSLYAMTDPFYMLMLMNNVGRDYIVWDKAAAIDFKKPGKGTVRAHFRFNQDEIVTIKGLADKNGKYIFTKPVQILDEVDEVVAEVQKTIYIRKKSAEKNRAQ